MHSKTTLHEIIQLLLMTSMASQAVTDGTRGSLLALSTRLRLWAAQQWMGSCGLLWLFLHCCCLGTVASVLSRLGQVVMRLS